MKKFEISFTTDPESGIYSANLVNATSAEQATAYYTAQGYTVAGCTETTSDPKPGQPVTTIPEDWEAPKEETAQEKTDRENWEHCKRIAEELDEIAEGNIYRCPHCGEFIKWDDDQYNEDEARYTCPECGEEFDESDLEAVSMWDYFNDVYDIEYRVGSDKQYRSVCLMVACGGPNIYIDTGEKAVLLYWWTDRARYSLLSSTAEAIDEVFEEYFNC